MNRLGPLRHRAYRLVWLARATSSFGDRLIFIAFAFAEEDDDQLMAIYHSHTRSAPYPSQTDVNFAAGWPGVEWLIVGVPKARNAEPEIRSYLIEDGAIREMELEVT